MIMRWTALVLILVALISTAEARCYKDAIGGGTTCDELNQARKAAALTKSDATVYNPPTKALHIGDASACSLSVVLADDSAAVTISNVQPGLVYSLAVKKLMAATTCAAVVGFW